MGYASPLRTRVGVFTLLYDAGKLPATLISITMNDENLDTTYSAENSRCTQLNLFDSTCLIVGIIVGSGIYETPSLIASTVEHPWELYLLWVIGGVISLCGALCYAELATAYPQSGGDVVYLGKAYGKWAGFLFGWLQTFVARPGDISMLSLVFARYVHVLTPAREEGPVPIWPALAIVVLLTLVNIMGLRFGKTAQNVLTVAKVLGILAIVGIAFLGPPSGAISEPVASNGGGVSLGVGLVLVLFTFGGWNEMVYVASEVKDPKRNISRALVLGTVAVMAIYLLTNMAYVKSLGLAGLASSSAIATDAVSHGWPKYGLILVALVVIISTAGSLNGLILTGARITGAMRPFPLFGWIGRWSDVTKTPVRALVLQGIVSVVVICIAKSFENALIYTASAVYTFYLATGLSVVVLRWKDPDTARPFRMSIFPLPLIVFSAGCIWAIKSAIQYKPEAALVCFAILGAGLLVFFGGRRRSESF